jgi:hypothetical protein
MGSSIRFSDGVTLMGSSIRFSDGVTFDLRGALRIVRERDGLYVVGEGCLIPVASEREALETLAALKCLVRPIEVTPASAA